MRNKAVRLTANRLYPEQRLRAHIVAFAQEQIALLRTGSKLSGWYRQATWIDGIVNAAGKCTEVLDISVLAAHTSCMCEGCAVQPCNVRSKDMDACFPCTCCESFNSSAAA